MTDQDQTERRLRAMLHARAEQIDSQLTGPQVRRRATRRAGGAGGVRRLAPVLATAAAVAVIASAATVVGTDHSRRDPAPVQPGGQTAARSATRTATITMSPTTPAMPTVPSTPQVSTVTFSPPIPAMPTVPTVSPSPVPNMTATSMPTGRMVPASTVPRFVR